MQDNYDFINKIYEDHRKVVESIGYRDLTNVVKMIADCLKSGRTVYACGNGGSAADAQHMVAELAGKFRIDRPGLRAIALTANTSVLTAIGNDFGYQFVFSRQIEALATAGDVIVLFTTSGSSNNILEAITAAGNKHSKVVAFVGPYNSVAEEYLMANRVEHVVISCGSTDTPRVQEAHELAYHIICELVEREMFGG